MTDKKPELSDAMKKKLEPKKFTKNPILGTKFTIAILLSLKSTMSILKLSD
jgi:ATP-binding protein involved in chromosome partitioning